MGAGALSEKYAADLDSAGASYINTVGKTTIYELANVIKNAKCLVSVDTGTMHFRLRYSNSDHSSIFMNKLRLNRGLQILKYIIPLLLTRNRRLKIYLML